jgi:2-amino-4-hydroxy-6-hydroxymethyldihydropteridine diphosphokinase
MKRVYLSLGSNLGDRRANIQQALDRLEAEGVKTVRVSSFYKTEPVGYKAQPWFLNCVAEVETDLMPLRLVQRCRAVERELGRRPGPRGGPRLIDIDILLYESAVVRSAEVTVPHPRMAERRFVLVPLGELAAQVRHPVTQQTVADMLHETPDHSQVVKLRAAESQTA